MTRMMKSFCAMAILVALVLNTGKAQQASITENSLTKPFSASVPNTWMTGGTATLTEDFIRLTPDTGSAKGGVWNLRPMSARDWTAELEFEVQGRGRVGADGMALWYTSTPAYTEGDAFGSLSSWRGLAVTIDTFDNDRKHDNPKIGVIVNDGSKTYDASTDGSELMLGSCVREVRNLNHPSKLRVTYLSGARRLNVDVDINNEGRWESCWAGDNVDLPAGYHFGITAATGGLTDNHDVRSFVVRPVDSENAAFAAAAADTPQEREEAARERAPEPNPHSRNSHFDDILRRAENIQRNRPINFAEQQQQQQQQHQQQPQQEQEETKNQEQQPQQGDSNTQANDAEIERMLSELERKVKNALESNNKCEETVNDVKNEILGKINNNVFTQSNTIDFKQLDSSVEALQSRIDTISMELNTLISNINKLSTETRTTIDSTNYMFWFFVLAAEVAAVFAFIHFKNKSRNSAKKMF